MTAIATPIQTHHQTIEPEMASITQTPQTSVVAAPVLSPAAPIPVVAATEKTRAPKRARTKTCEETSENTSSTPVPSTPVTSTRRTTSKPVVNQIENPEKIEKIEKSDETPVTDEVVPANKDWLIVAKSVRTMLKGMPNSMHCGADALPTLNIRVQELLSEAAARANGNSRKTIKACDF
jgi:hypothetical protein